MKLKQLNKCQLKDLAVQLIARKDAIRAYMRKEISKEDLTNLGIKLAKPI